MNERLQARKDIQDILRILANGGEDRLAPLKELFWARLGYDRVNIPLSRQGWTDDQRNALAEDPILWASGGAGDAFHVIYLRLTSTDLKRTLERPVVDRLLREHPYALFVFSNNLQDNWHFLNVKYDERVERRQLFRRITIGPEERLRTASERIALLDMDVISPHSRVPAPLIIQERNDIAFDVEKVQKEFFRTLQTIYEESIIPDISKKLPDEKKAREAGLILLNRLIFLYFIQKKGWLNKKANYLADAFKEHRRKPASRSYFSEFLCLLFDALAKPKLDRMYDYMVGFRAIPFLNGGLFEPNSLASSADLHVTNATFIRLFDDLLESYNFTVMEDTPLDVEVAVDPEMLGKIFEELVTGRHDTGAYYTPRPIVSFMCKESLKGYLADKQEKGEAPPPLNDAIERFVENHDASGLSHPEAVLDKLRAIKVCDPACGSGAYLVGMLQELMALRHALFQKHKVDSRTDYDRKLDIIQNNLYGVDIEATAVNIARLRLWLTLCVEYETQDGGDPPPLPNLDFKIEEKDSVLAPKVEHGESLHEEQIKQFSDLKARYMKEPYNKAPLLHKIQQMRKELSLWLVHDQANAGGTDFDWRVDFAEVLSQGENPGFDIVIANPPFVRMELIKDMKRQLASLYPEFYAGRADLFTYFYARGIELLKQGGLLVYICSSTWTKTATAEKLRKYLRERVTIFRFIDFGNLVVFENVTTYPSIIIAGKVKPSKVHSIRANQVRTVQPSEVESELHVPGILVPQSSLEDSGWRFEKSRIASLRQKIKDVGVPLKKVVNGQLCRGIPTGLNEAFVIDQRVRDALIADNPQSKDVSSTWKCNSF